MKNARKSGVNDIIKNLKKFLSEAIKRNFYNGLLFSGGLDTSILASLNPKVVCLTVSLGSEAQDLRFSESLVKHLNMKQLQKVVDVGEAIDAIPEVIKILKSFDPAIPNDLVVYFGLKNALELGIDAIATGDGSDELFGGYSFMKNINDLASYIQKISQNLNFSSNDIGKFYGIKIIQPFIDKEVIDFALKIPADLKIKEEDGKFIGKWILRKTFEDVLPKEIVWQGKRPLEYGSAMFRLRQIISDKISDEEFREDLSPVRFMSKEHFYYYKIYREVVGEVPKPKNGQNCCPGCGTGMGRSSFHCKICGYVLDWGNRYHRVGD